MLKKRKFDVLLEDGNACRTWVAGEPVKVGDHVSGTAMTTRGIIVRTGLVKEILAIDGVKQKTSQKENADV